MIFWFSFLIISSLSLVKIKDMSPAYILDEDESFSLALNDFFSGDNLIFRISPENNTVLQTSSSYVQSTFNYPDIEGFNRILLVQSWFSDSTSNQLLIYYSENEVTIFYLNLQFQMLWNLTEVTLDSIHSCQFYSGPENFGLFVITWKFQYRLYFVPIKILSFKPGFGDPVLIDLPLDDLHLPRLVQGGIDSILLITGYREKGPVLIFLNITNSTFPTVFQEIELNYQVDQYNEIFSVSNKFQFFVIVPVGSEIIRIDLSSQNVFYISNSLKLPSFACNVTSLQLNFFKRYLMIGLVNGFIISSFDFQQVYTKQEPRVFENVHFSYTEFNDYVLVERQDVFWLFELGENFQITGNASFVKKTHGINWGVYSYYKSNCVFLSGQNGSIELFNVTFYYPKLTFSSSEQSFRYNLTALQQFPLRTASLFFNVSRPDKNPGYAQPFAMEAIEVYFDNLTAQVWIPWQMYVIGGNLSVKSCNFQLDCQCSYFKDELKWVPNFREVEKLEIGPNNFTSIVGNGDIIILYNISTASIYNQTSLITSISESGANIKNIIKCEVGYVIYAEISENFTGLIIYSSDPLFLVTSKESLKSPCLRVSCSRYYIVCEAEFGAYTYKIFDNRIWFPEKIMNSKLPGKIESSFLLQDNYLAVLLNTSQLMIIDLDTTWLIKNEINGPMLSLDYSGKKILSYTNILVVDEDFQVHMYDFYFNYLKKFLVLPGGKLKLYKDYLISYTESQILIINTLQWVTNSTIVNVSLNNWPEFSGYSDETHPLRLYFLNENFVSLFEVPEKYNNLNFTVKIIENDNISSIQYGALINCSIENQFNEVNLSIPLSLMVNGETIYKNETKIRQIQENNMKYQCGQVFLLPLGDIFLGQDLNGQLVDNPDYVQLGQRFYMSRELKPQENYDVIFYSQKLQMFISVKMCQLYILDFSMSEILEIQTFDVNNSYICDCHTGSVINDLESVYFVVGCSVAQNIYKEISGLDSLFHVLVFAKYDFFGLWVEHVLNVDFSPLKMKTTGLNGGEFIVLTAEEYYIQSLSTFYSNHLTITHGIIQGGIVTIFNHSCIFSEVFFLDNYYLSDFDVIFDPMFSVFYIYALDVYFGLRIVKFQRDLICEDSGLVSFESSLVGYSVIVCGSNLLIAMDNTDINIYYLYNWTLPRFQSSILAYTDTYEAVQSSLRCSSDDFPHYAYLQMNNSGNFSVHIVDLLSSNLSNILIDFNLPNASTDPLRLSTFLDPNGTLALVNSGTNAIFSLSPFTLEIDTSKSCEKSRKKSFKINVKNSKSGISTASFTLTIEKYSQPDKIFKETFKFWMLLVIFLIVLLLSLSIYYLIKKFMRKGRAVNDLALFDYKNEFRELESLKS